MSSRSVVEVEYTDERTGQRIRERKVQEVPWEQVDRIRNRELALVRRDSSPSPPPRYGRDDDRFEPRRGQEDYTVRRVERQRRSEEDLVPYRRNDDYDDRGERRPRQAAASRYDDDSDSESSRERRHRRRRRDDRRRTRSEVDNQQRDDNDDNRSRLWYSGRYREDGNFFEKNFDSSYDGLIAAAAGAALGAITVRHIAAAQEEEDPAKWNADETKEGKQKKLLKMVGGAALGAAAFNAGENWFRIYTEDREERKEGKSKEKRDGKRREQENGFMPMKAALGPIGSLAQKM